MSAEGDRQLVEAMAERAALSDRNKLQPMLGVVVDVGTGAELGMVRVRREPHEPTDAGRGFYYVVGAVPTVGATVWCVTNFATGFVFGDIVAGAGYDTPAEVLAALLTVDGSGSLLDADKLDGVEGAGYAPASHVGTGGTAQHPAGTTGTAGFISTTDKTKLDGLSAQAIGCFKAGKSADQLNITSATDTKVTFPSETFDVSGWYDAANSRFIPLKAGYYRINASLFITTVVASQRVELNVRVNGIHTHQLVQSQTSNTGQIGPSGSAVLFLDGIDDFVEIYVFHTFGVNTPDIIAGTGTYFSGEFIGTA